MQSSMFFGAPIYREQMGLGAQKGRQATLGIRKCTEQNDSLYSCTPQRTIHSDAPLGQRAVELVIIPTSICIH